MFLRDIPCLAWWRQSSQVGCSYGTKWSWVVRRWGLELPDVIAPPLADSLPCLRWKTSPRQEQKRESRPSVPSAEPRVGTSFPSLGGKAYHPKHRGLVPLGINVTVVFLVNFSARKENEKGAVWRATFDLPCWWIWVQSVLLCESRSLSGFWEKDPGLCVRPKAETRLVHKSTSVYFVWLISFFPSFFLGRLVSGLCLFTS